MQNATSSEDRAEDHGHQANQTNCGAIRKIASFSVWNQNVIFPLYVILGEGEIDYGDKLDYILHSYAAIVYLSPSKTYNMLSCDTLVD